MDQPPHIYIIHVAQASWCSDSGGPLVSTMRDYGLERTSWLDERRIV